ncbi:uncharacterized protein LDX57_008228 [Aspergillus melleus]|uniref:uncharacterized protein n=1 Tax=Aspergillus melleus TaxID=138277 RepID=UPI001E8E1160|nr:uncharacterized protein LDX57_008228 [Aspergillus melleus]KAH8430564.1 hypothetical protein LDX57_008228 [Aspergillus melleus]
MEWYEKPDEKSPSTMLPWEDTGNVYDFLKGPSAPAKSPRRSSIGSYDKSSEVSASTTSPIWTPNTEASNYVTKWEPAIQNYAFLPPRAPKGANNTKVHNHPPSPTVFHPVSPTLDPAFDPALYHTAVGQQFANINHLQQQQQQQYGANRRQNPRNEWPHDIASGINPRLETLSYPTLYEEQSCIPKPVPDIRRTPINESPYWFPYQSLDLQTQQDPQDTVPIEMTYEEEIQQLKMRVRELENKLAQEREIKEELLIALQRNQGSRQWPPVRPGPW